MPIALALVAYGLYALFLTQRAKSAWPKSFFILAWVLLGLVVVGPWVNAPRARQGATQAHNSAQAPTSTQNNALIPLNGQLDSSASSTFDPSTARPVDQPTAPHIQFDPSTARPVEDLNGFDPSRARLVKE